MESGSNEVPSKEESLVIVSHPGRRLPPSYHGVILARWLRSLRNLNPMFKKIEQEAYFKHYEPYIKNIIARPNTTIRLLVLQDDVDIVFGWCVYEGDILHYIHIQDPYRNQGRSHDLIPKGIKYITHETTHWTKKLGKKKYKNLIYNPFL